MYSVLLNISTKLELRKATHAAKLELLDATLVALESYKRRCTVWHALWYTWLGRSTPYYGIKRGMVQLLFDMACIMLYMTWKVYTLSWYKAWYGAADI